jgi:SAM-dependent methyltransferase
MPDFDPKQVFSPRVENYISTRPGYPPEVLEPLVSECGLKADWQVADIGSGPGLLAKLFLDFGCAVTGVEPNAEMRLAGERILAGYPNFTSLPGSAEATGLAGGSIRLVTAGMAFHWFDAARAAEEFRRILVPGGWAALVWNRALPGPDAFMQAYTGLVLEYAPGWTETQRRDGPGSSLDLPGFFGGAYRRRAFPHPQALDWDGLRGRTLSIAHLPPPDDLAHALLLDRLREAFERHHRRGQVTLLYEAELYYGRLGSA